MSDNITLPGTGAVVATETVGSAQVQVVKPAWGPTDTGTDPDAVGNAFPVTPWMANPTSTLTRPANTTAYSQGDLIANSATIGDIVVPSFTAARLTGGSGFIRRARLVTDVTTTNSWSQVSVQIDFWSAAPTFTNGDGGAYAPATGSAAWLGSMTILLEQFGDGAVGVGIPDVGSELGFQLASGQSIYWSMQVTSASGATPISGQTFTITPEIGQN